MPPLKHPASLRAMTMDYCVETLLRLCIQLSKKYSEKEFPHAISTVRKNWVNYIPGHFLGELFDAVIKKFHQRGNSWSAHKDVMELLMDVDIIGLRINALFVNLKDANRLRDLVELNMGQISFDSHTFFENCQLSELRKVSFPRCRDYDLTVIGQNCARLQRLTMSESSVTDEGLRALSQCRDLRVLDITGCPQVSHIGINHLIGELDKLEDFSCCSWNEDSTNHSDGCYFLSSLDRPCLSVKRFSLVTDAVTDTHLRLVVKKFPNLTRFETRFQSLGDLSILKSLRNLEGIVLERQYFSSNRDVGRVWRSLELLLSFIGGNVKSLKLSNLGERSVSKPGNVTYILEACPNIEYLECYHGFYDLVVPSSQNLRVLCLIYSHKIYRNNIIRIITFDIEKTGNMLNLESLDLGCLQVSLKTLKSIMFDDVKFPKLTMLKTGGLMRRESEEIIKIAKNNNLEFAWDGRQLFRDERR